jgi:hypothetical protein
MSVIFAWRSPTLADDGADDNREEFLMGLYMFTCSEFGMCQTMSTRNVGGS